MSVVESLYETYINQVTPTDHSGADSGYDAWVQDTQDPWDAWTEVD